MAFTFSGASGLTSATIPSHSAGDLIVAFAYRDGSNTRPTIPSGQNWTAVHDANGANTNSHVVAIKTASGSSEVTGTFTNATSLIVVVVKSDVGEIGYKNGAIGTAASTTLSFTGFTLDNPTDSSRILAFAGHRSVNTTLDQAPAGFTNITSDLDATDEVAGHYSTDVVSSFNTLTQSVGGTSSGWRTHTLEVWEVPPANNYTITCETGSYSYTGQSASLKKASNLICSAGSYLYTGQSATLTYAGTVEPTSYTLTCSTGNYTLTGQSSNLRLTRKIICSVGNYSYTGQSSQLTLSRKLVCASGSYSLSGQSVNLRQSSKLICSSGQYTYAGSSALLKQAYKLISLFAILAVTDISDYLYSTTKIKMQKVYHNSHF